MEQQIRATYDRIAAAYDKAFNDELDHKPLDRALLDSFAEQTAAGRIADLGCGPGQVTGYLARHHPDVIGVDLSPEMITIARARHPGLTFEVASMLELPVPDGAWAGVVALYSIIHLTSTGRATAVREMARVVQPDGWVLLSFHIDSAEVAAGQTNHLTSWFGHDVDLDVTFLAPREVQQNLTDAGLTVTTTVVRQPLPSMEFPSRRCYLLAHKEPALS